MHIAFDKNPIYTSRAGIARYTQSLYQALLDLNPNCTISTLAWECENFAFKQPTRALKTAYRELIWAPFLAPGKLAKTKVDMLHSTSGYFVQPPNPIKNIVTLHDLAIIRHPERFRKWHRFSGLRRLKKIHRADHIISISQFTADEAMQLLDLPAKKMTVIYNGCNFTNAVTTPTEREPETSLPDAFFLFVGSLEPGKNLALLQEAYEKAKSVNDELPPLLIVGVPWKNAHQVIHYPDNWQFLGHLNDPELVYLYRRALALLFPTKYEGFGLPVAEAMALNCPVVCSPIASLPEVGGDAAYYADLTSDAYLSAMKEISQSKNLREELKSKGQAQAQKFTWEKCARQVLETYRNIQAS